MRKLMLLVLCLLLFSSFVAAQERTYTVQRGDTITAIANRFDVSAEAILIANNIIDPNRIRSGQVLTIPSTGVTNPEAHVVGHGESLTSIADRYNTDVATLTDMNAIANPNALVVGQVLELPSSGGAASFDRRYVVAQGDTLASIARRFGTTWQALAHANRIANANYIQAGMVILVPAAGSVPADAPVPPTTTYTPPPRPTYATYVVQRGDMLSYIGLRFGVTAEAIRHLNGITNSREIYPGDVLLIPAAGYHPAPPPPRHLHHGRYYYVRSGDTLFAIAASFHANIYDIAEANGILNLNRIYAGMPLLIPNR